MSFDSHIADDLSVKNGDYQDALNRCQKRLSEVSEDSLAAADAYKTMGGIYASYLEDKDTAIKYINRAIQIDENKNFKLGLVQDYNHMSKIYTYISGGDVEEGLRYIEKAERLCKENGLLNSIEMANTLVNKGRLHNIKDEYETAIEFMIAAQEIYKEDPEGEDITLYIEMGQIYTKMSEYEKAEEQFQMAQKICEIKGDEYFLAEVKNQFGWLFGKQKDYKKTVHYYEQALDFYKKNGYVKEEALICSNMAYAGYRLDWGADRVIPLSIDACRAIEKVSPETTPSKESKKNYKHNLKMYYQGWSNDTSEEGYEAWYQEVVLNGKDWKEVNVEAETKAN